VFSFETSCSFSRRPFHYPPVHWAMSSQTGPPKMALYSLTGNARSPLHAEPAQPHPDDDRRKTRIQVGCIVARFSGGSNDPTNLRAICSVCNDGLRHLTLDRPSSRELLIQIRRATGTDQIEVLRWLVKKFPNGAQGKGGELNRRRSNA
jgi:hypothetical protein